MTQIDARGLSCPEPVVLAMNEGKKGVSGFEMLTDAAVSMENVSRYAKNNGFSVEITENSGEYTIRCRKLS